MRGEVTGVTRLAGGMVDLRVAAPLMENPAPGRFVHVAVPGFTLRRPISLCGFEDGTARLVFAVKGGGTAAMAALRPGDPVDLLGALGNGFPFEGDPSVRTLLIGGGAGIPPLLYYAKTHENTHAVLGFRSPELAFLTEEFPSADLCFGTDYPHERLESLLPAGRVLACGPRPLLSAAAKVCAERGIPCFVSVEERMACGVGACLVCVCAAGGQYRRVCKDGPVFDAADIGWEEDSDG